MGQEKSRAEQLEELLRELREKRLAQTMELEQIRADYLNNPKKPIQPISDALGQKVPAQEMKTPYSGRTTAAPRTQQPISQSSQTAAKKPAQSSGTSAQRPVQQTRRPESAVQQPAAQRMQSGLQGQMPQQKPQAEFRPATQNNQPSAQNSRREGQQAGIPMDKPQQRPVQPQNRAPERKSDSQAAAQSQAMEQRAQELARRRIQERETLSRTQEIPRASRRLNETIQFEIPKDRPSFTSFSNTAQMKPVKLPEETRDEPQTANKKSKRSIFSNLIGEKPDSGSIEFDPINKDMLAPTIERGVDAVPQEPKTVHSHTSEILMPEQKKDYTENHPLFTQSFTTETIIPQEAKNTSARQAQMRSAQEAFRTAPISDTAQRSAKKGVLNVRENVDDNFREFFGDTVIIDRESLNEKAKRQRKIKDFVVAEKEGEVGGPVFEDEEENGELESAVEYRSDEDTEAVNEQLSTDRRKSFAAVLATGLCAFVLLILDVMAELELFSGGLAEPMVFYGLNLALLLVAIGFCIKPVFQGFGRLVSFHADENSLISFACIAAIVECIVLMFSDGFQDFGGACACVAAGAVFFNRLGVYLRDKRILSSFRTVSDSYEKYSSAVLDEQNFTRRITRDLDLNNPRILIKRKTGFTENFLPHSYSKPQTGPAVYTAASVLFLIGVACGVLGYFKGGNVFTAVRYLAMAAAFTGPFVSTLAQYLPIYCMQRSLSKVGAVVPGYSAADEVCDANCVVLEGRELFPKGSVLLHGIKTFERERIDKAILYAASVVIQSCDTMAPMFMNVIQNKTEMLYPVDGVEYESGLGYSFWIDKTRIFLGTRELLQSHEIEVPSRDYESRYTKTNSRDALYLAVAGKLYAMFVISYSPNAEVENALRGFEREGVDILVHTRDFNITPEKIARLYQIPKSMVAVVREDDVAELTKRTDYVGRAPSAITHIGSLSSFVRGIIACYNVRGSVRMAGAIELACMIVGAVVACVLSALSMIGTIGVATVLFFQLLCCLLLTIVVSARRY